MDQVLAPPQPAVTVLWWRVKAVESRFRCRVLVRGTQLRRRIAKEIGVHWAARILFFVQAQCDAITAVSDGGETAKMPYPSKTSNLVAWRI